MKSLLLVTVLALIAGFDGVKAGPSCRSEIAQYTSKNRVCAENSVHIHSFVNTLAKGGITYNDLADIIEVECERANSASCYSDISKPIASSCNEVESMQHYRNALKTVTSFNDYMCQNNGGKFLDFVKNGGAACFNNDEKKRCYSERFNEKVTDVSDQRTFTNANVCHVMNSDWECLNFIKDCENQNVYAFYQEILGLAREKFSC